MIVKLWLDTPWIAGRLRELMGVVFRTTAVTTPGTAHGLHNVRAVFIAGSQKKIGEVLADPQLAASVAKNSKVLAESAELTLMTGHIFIDMR